MMGLKKTDGIVTTGSAKARRSWRVEGGGLA